MALSSHSDNSENRPSYSEALLRKGCFLTRRHHRKRWGTTLRLISNRHFRRALDWGCGDGHFLKLAYEAGILESGIGVDTNPQMILSAKEAFAPIRGFSFFCLSESNPISFSERFDLLFARKH